MENFFEYLSSFLMGLSLGVFGSGGSIFTIPILTTYYHIPVILATSYSLLIIFIISIIGIFRIRNDGNILYKDALLFLVPSSLTMFFSRLLFVHIIPKDFSVFSLEMSSESLILILLSLLMMLAAMFISIRKNFTYVGKSRNILIIQGVIIGFITSIVGAGGGFLIAPTFIIFNNFSVKQATATSLFIVCINSFVGFMADLSYLEYLDFWIILTIFFWGSIGMYASNFITKILPEILLKLLYVMTLITISASMLIGQIIIILR